MSRIYSFLLALSVISALKIREGGNEDYYKVIKYKSRSEGVFILYNTYSPEIKCPICEPFEKTLKGVIAAYPERGSKFVRLEFKKCREAFTMRKIESVPWLEYYPPCKENNCSSPKTYPVHSKGSNSEALYEFVSDLIGHPPKSKLPLIALAITLLISVIFVAKYFDFLYGLACNKWLWALGSAVISLIMTSGFMWSRIRKPPPFHRADGVISYFAKGLTFQFGMESQLIFGINLGIFLVGIAISEVNKRVGSGKSQKYADYLIFSLVVAFIFLFSVELKFFSTKQTNYPFRLLL